MSSILSQFVKHKVEPGNIEQDYEEVAAHLPDAIKLPHGMIPMLVTNLRDCNNVDPKLQQQNRSSLKI